MPTMRYELYYWPDIQGRGEFIRLALEAAGADYIDVARGPKSKGQGVPALLALMRGAAAGEGGKGTKGTKGTVKSATSSASKKDVASKAGGIAKGGAGDEAGAAMGDKTSATASSAAGGIVGSALGPNTIGLPFAPPFLKAGDELIAQTAHILAYLGPALKLVPRDARAQRWAHQLQLTVTDLLVEVHDTHPPIASSLYYEEQKGAARKRAAIFIDERIPKYLDYFERVLAGNPRGPAHMVGGALSYVDLSMFQVIEGLRYAFPKAMARLEGAEDASSAKNAKGARDAKEAKNAKSAKETKGAKSAKNANDLTHAHPWPHLAALHDSVAALPRIAAYLASKRRIPFNESGIFRHYPELDR